MTDLTGLCNEIEDSGICPDSHSWIAHKALLLVDGIHERDEEIKRLHARINEARNDEKNLWLSHCLKQAEDHGFWQLSASQHVWDRVTGEKYSFEGVLLGVGTSRQYIVRSHSSGLVRTWEQTEVAKK